MARLQKSLALLFTNRKGGGGIITYDSYQGSLLLLVLRFQVAYPVFLRPPYWASIAHKHNTRVQAQPL